MMAFDSRMYSSRKKDLLSSHNQTLKKSNSTLSYDAVLQFLCQLGLTMFEYVLAVRNAWMRKASIPIQPMYIVTCEDHESRMIILKSCKGTRGKQENKNVRSQSLRLKRVKCLKGQRVSFSPFQKARHSEASWHARSRNKPRQISDIPLTENIQHFRALHRLINHQLSSMMDRIFTIGKEGKNMGLFWKKVGTNWSLRRHLSVEDHAGCDTPSTSVRVLAVQRIKCSKTRSQSYNQALQAKDTDFAWACAYHS